MWLISDLWSFFFPRGKTVPVEEIVDRSDEEPDPSQNIRPFVYFVSGGFGGVCSTIVGQPMDTVKTRLQTMKVRVPPVYSGTFDCAKKILQRQGIRGLYEGLGIQITSTVPAFAISFFGYGLGKSLQEAGHVIDHEFTPLNHFIAGTVAGSCTSGIMAPAERVKVILQVQSARESEVQVTYRDRCGPKYTNSLDVVVKLYQKGGLKSIYKGAMLTFMRDIPACGTFFMVYEWLRLSIATYSEDPYKTIIAGGTAGIANWLVALPCDNLKSRLQSAQDCQYPNGLRDILIEIQMERGVLALYRGLMPVLLRSFPANAVCFLGFEYSKDTLTNYIE